MKAVPKLLPGLVGAVVGLALAVGIEAGVIGFISNVFDVRLMPRGLGWVTLPILAMIGGWRLGYNLEALGLIFSTARYWVLDTRLGRASLLIIGSWSAGWSYYAFTNEDFASSYFGWGEEEWLKYLEWLFGVPALAILVALAGWWVMRGKAN